MLTLLRSNEVRMGFRSEMPIYTILRFGRCGGSGGRGEIVQKHSFHVKFVIIKSENVATCIV